MAQIPSVIVSKISNQIEEDLMNDQWYYYFYHWPIKYCAQYVLSVLSRYDIGQVPRSHMRDNNGLFLFLFLSTRDQSEY